LVDIGLRASRGDIVSLSLGSDGNVFGMVVNMEASRLAMAGILVFASAGNKRSAAVLSPANAPGVFAVGGLDFTTPDDSIWVGMDGDGSSGAAGEVAFFAPAEEVPVARATTSAATGVAFGTSLSSPLVAGVAFYHSMFAELRLAPGPASGIGVMARALLLRDSTVHTSSQVTVPYTPTRILYKERSLAANVKMTLFSSAADESGVWMAGLSDTSILARIPVSSNGDVAGAASVVVLTRPQDVATARCTSVSAASQFATAGCHDPQGGAYLRFFKVDGATVQSAPTDVIALTGLPVATAMDRGGDTFFTDKLRVAVTQNITGLGPNQNPLTGTTPSLVVARAFSGNAWEPNVLAVGTTGVAYSPKSFAEVNCFDGPVPECDIYVLLTTLDARRVELWHTRALTSTGSAIPAATLVAHRADTGQFEQCYVPGWASSFGLEGAGLVAGPSDVDRSTTKWSFAVNRIGTEPRVGGCVFNNQVRIVNEPGGALDVLGRKGESWLALARGVSSRTSLALTSVWTASGASGGSLEYRVRSAIRTLHPRGDDDSVPPDLAAIIHTESGPSAVGLYREVDGLWRVGRIDP
jgi:hypothetical protein